MAHFHSNPTASPARTALKNSQLIRGRHTIYLLFRGQDTSSYFVAKLNAGALGAGHLQLSIAERISAGGLVKGYVVRLYNLNPAVRGSRAFWIDLYNRGDAYEFEYQVVCDFVRSEGINRFDRQNNLCHDQEISKGTHFHQPAITDSRFKNRS
jgi:hypothetical protein